MADEKKPDLNLDDWDSIPLDPDADDWDDEIPSAERNDASSANPSESDATPPDNIELNIEAEVLDEPLPELGDILENSFSSSESTVSQDDIVAEDSMFDANDGIDELDELDSPSFSLDAAMMDALDTANVRDGAEAEVDSFSADTQLDLGDVSEEDSILPTKKVELDIDGVFLEDPAEETADDSLEDLNDEVPVAAESEAAENIPVDEELITGEQQKPRISKRKLIILIAASLLLLAGIGAIIKIFFLSTSEAPLEDTETLIITPAPSVREPSPGEITLGAFYIGLPGGQEETLVELTAILHYNNKPDKVLIEQNMTVIRDIIFRGFQDKGAQVIASGDVQRDLRNELEMKINKVLGRDAVSYVQITQIRILH